MAVSVIEESGLTAVDSFFGNDCDTNGFQADASCSICSSSLGWLNLRHQCSFCSKSVCANCSLSNVHLEGHKYPQRACNMCANIIPTAHGVKDRLTAIVADEKMPDGSYSPRSVGSEISNQSELSRTKQGITCMLSNVLFVIAANMTQEAGSEIAGDQNFGSFQKAWNCGICNTALGWRHVKPRHHCRFCGVSVCGNCSMSTVYLESRKALLRTCNMCANIIPAAHTVKSRLNGIAGHLNALGGSDSRLTPRSKRLEAIDEGARTTHGIARLQSVQDSANTAKVEQEDDAVIDAVTFNAEFYDVL